MAIHTTFANFAQYSPTSPCASLNIKTKSGFGQLRLFARIEKIWRVLAFAKFPCKWPLHSHGLKNPGGGAVNFFHRSLGVQGFKEKIAID
jgi:hypothetical protein